MKKNMGTLDRLLRVVVALIIGVLFYLGKLEGMVGYVLVLLAGVFLITSIFSFCPLYIPFGINTCEKKEG